MNPQSRSRVFVYLIALTISASLLPWGVYAAGNEALTNQEEVRKELAVLFKKGDVSALNKMAETLVRNYERDGNQFAPMRTFFNVLPNAIADQTQATYDAWVARFPASYSAYYARARYFSYIAMNARGSDFITNVPAANIKRMQYAFGLAKQDLIRSLPLSTKPVLAYFQLIRIARYTGKPQEGAKYYDASTRADPDIYMIAAEYLVSLQPRWGGSFEALDHFPAAARARGLSESKTIELKGFAKYLSALDYALQGNKKRAKQLLNEVANDEHYPEYRARAFTVLGDMASDEKNPEAASAYYKAALNITPNSVRLLSAVASAERDANHPTEALKYYDRAIALDPNDMWVLSGRAWIQHYILGNDKASLSDFMRAAQLGEPVAQNVLGYFYWTGKVVSKNQAEALYWWTLSAKQKNETAMENLKIAKRELGADYLSLIQAAKKRAGID